MPGRAVDTNIFAYAADVRRHPDDEAKIPRATEIVMNLLTSGTLVIPAQVLAELHNLLRKKARIGATTAAEMVMEYAAGATLVPTNNDILQQAFELCVAHGLQTYDAIILSAAASAGCDTLYSEDMQAGFVWNGVRIVDPFA